MRIEIVARRLFAGGGFDLVTKTPDIATDFEYFKDAVRERCAWTDVDFAIERLLSLDLIECVLSEPCFT